MVVEGCLESAWLLCGLQSSDDRRMVSGNRRMSGAGAVCLLRWTAAPVEGSQGKEAGGWRKTERKDGPMQCSFC